MIRRGATAILNRFKTFVVLRLHELWRRLWRAGIFCRSIPKCNKPQRPRRVLRQTPMQFVAQIMTVWPRLSILLPIMRYFLLLFHWSYISVSRTVCSPECKNNCFGAGPEHCCYQECMGGCHGPGNRECWVRTEFFVFIWLNQCIFAFYIFLPPWKHMDSSPPSWEIRTYLRHINNRIAVDGCESSVKSQGNAFENVVCIPMVIFARPQCVHFYRPAGVSTWLVLAVSPLVNPWKYLISKHIRGNQIAFLRLKLLLVIYVFRDVQVSTWILTVLVPTCAVADKVSFTPNCDPFMTTVITKSQPLSAWVAHSLLHVHQTSTATQSLSLLQTCHQSQTKLRVFYGTHLTVIPQRVP